MSRRTGRSVKTLLEYLTANKTTQAEFAERVGVSESAINRYIHGNRNPRLELAVKIAKLTGVPVEALIGHRRTDAA